MKAVDLHVRLPAELHAAIVAQARRERRSLNAQVILLLERAVHSTPASDR